MAVLAAALALLVVVSPARAATPGLSGVWLNSSSNLAAYDVHMSPDGQTLTTTWQVVIGRVQEGLVGTFTGRLNQTGTAYTGSMNVKVGSIDIGGTMTIAISSQEKFGYPLLNLSYAQDNGVSGSLTLQMWLTSPAIGSPPAFQYYCPSPQACQGEAEVKIPGAAPGVPKTGIVGAVHFTIEPGDSRRIALSLDKAGRSLLSKRHSLRAQVLVLSLGKSVKYLPELSTLATVTFRAG